MQFSWKSFLKKHGKILALAPMDGWTDSAFRQIVKKISPEIVAFTEFVSVDGLTHRAASEKLFQKALAHDEIEKPLIVQLFGDEPEKFARAAEIVEKSGAAAVDLNFGCPARRVLRSGHGAEILKNPKLAVEIFTAAKSATNLEISVKTRLGFFNRNEIFSFAEKLFSAGLKTLFLHGRTAAEKFTGRADWETIFEVKKKFPEKIVVGNGDICDLKSARKVLQNCDGAMIGRAATANPWIFAEILSDGNFVAPNLKQKTELFLEFSRAKFAHKNRAGILEIRKFFAAFFRGFSGAKKFREKIFTAETIAEIEKICGEIGKIGS
jgi:nifR3 family TIM-barrel protein